jgi:hypothetical protein
MTSHGFEQLLRNDCRVTFKWFLKRKKLTAIYGARMRGSVFRIAFQISAIEFESVETSPGFAQIRVEN